MDACFLKAGRIPYNGGFRMRDYWVWCGSVVAETGKGWHMYAARWPKSYPMFEGYLYLSEIVRAFSASLCGPYEYCETILPSGNPAGFCGRMVHNPVVLQWRGRYYLYYIGSTYDGATPPPDRLGEFQELQGAIYGRIRIGLAVADSPAGPWRALETPVLEPRPGQWDAKIVTNPAPCVGPDGRIYLYYRSSTAAGLRIGLAIAERPEGPYRRATDGPVLDNFNVEDPFVWHDGNTFHMIAKDMTGAITGEVIAGAHFVAPDGIRWSAATPPKAYSRKVVYEDGKEATLGCLERPQLLFDAGGKPRCLFAAAADGPGTFRKALSTWNIAIPLETEN